MNNVLKIKQITVTKIFIIKLIDLTNVFNFLFIKLMQIKIKENYVENWR